MDREVVVLDEPAQIVRLRITSNKDCQRPNAGFQCTVEWAGRSVASWLLCPCQAIVISKLMAYTLFVGDLGHTDKRVPAHVELTCCGDGLAKTLQGVGMSGLADVDHAAINVFL